MWDTLIAALANLMSVQHLGYMMLGILVGLVIGVLPALGGIAGMSLLLPFVFGMDKVSALAMLIGLVAVVPTGDTFTSVLIGVPGAAGSQATILDGFPLAKRGQAARALSAAFAGSMLGGVFGALVLTAFVVVAKPVILAFGTPELFMLAVLGLSVVGPLMLAQSMSMTEESKGTPPVRFLAAMPRKPWPPISVSNNRPGSAR